MKPKKVNKSCLKEPTSTLTKKILTDYANSVNFNKENLLSNLVNTLITDSEKVPWGKGEKALHKS